MIIKKDKEMKEPTDILTYYELFNYRVLRSKNALPFQEQVIKSSKINKQNSVVTSFINLPREYDVNKNPLCFETIAIQENNLYKFERSSSMEMAEQNHLRFVEYLTKSL